MIQIFEIVQDGGTGFWSENKDLIAAFGVFISFLAAAASIWAIRINKKTLDEIKTQRIESYKPELAIIDVNYALQLDEDGNLLIHEIKDLNNINKVISEYFKIINIGLGVSKKNNIKIELNLDGIKSLYDANTEETVYKFKETFEYINPFSIDKNETLLSIPSIIFNLVKILIHYNENSSKFLQDSNDLGKMIVKMSFSDLGNMKYEKLYLGLIVLKKIPNLEKTYIISIVFNSLN